MPYVEERSAVPYDRNAMAERSEELLAVPKEVDIKELSKTIKNENKKITRETVQIKRKPIMKQRIVHMYVSGYYTISQMARILGLHQGTIYKALRDEDVKAMIRAYQDDEKEIVDQALRSLRMKAVLAQAELLDSTNDVVRANVAKDLLDRTGHKAETKQNINVTHTYEERLSALLEGATFQEVPYVIDDEEETNKTEGAVNGD